MDALFVNHFVIILILIMYPRQHSTILYVIKRNERRSAHPEGRYPMDRKLDDFLFYFPRIVMALIGAAAFAFGAWFSQFYYLYLNCIVLPISWAIAAYGIECASQVVKAYRCSL